MRKFLASIVASVAILCGAVAAVQTASATATAPHVMVVMLENKGYANTLGACSSDPYLCSLAAKYASDTTWYGTRHPSEPNYLAVTTGSTDGCTSDTCFKTLNVPSLGGQLTGASIPWTAYMESMPSACYTKQWASGTGSAALYGEKHNPFVVVSDVLNNGCAQHVLPYPGSSSLVSTLDGGSAPDFVWITPNQQDDMHTGSVTKGDTWLKANIAPVLTSAWFTNFNSTVVITMDEGGKPNGDGQVGGHIIEVVISNNAQGKGNIATVGDHYGTLRTIEKAFGLPLLGGAQQSSNGDLSALFGGSVSPPPTPTPTATPTATPTPSGCNVAAGASAATVQSDVATCKVINLAAGTYAWTNHVVVSKPVTIDGAGASTTFIVQHAAVNVFQITVPGVTIENLNVNTATYNPGVPPVQKSPVPGTIFSAQSHTSLINVTSEAGTGFGIRITGSNPCDAYSTQGTVVTNVSSTNTGSGGFTALDIDCTNGATLTNITIHGVYIAFYESENVKLTGESYTPGPYQGKCATPDYVSGPATDLTLANITGGGKVIAKASQRGPVTNLTVTNDTRAAGC